MKIGAVVVAGGSGQRLPGEVPKQLRDLGGIPILEWSVRAFRSHARISEVVVALPAELVADPPEWLTGVRVVAGGETRAESVVSGVGAISDAVDVVLVHDGVRPFVGSELIDRVARASAEGPVVPAVRVTDTIKRIASDGTVLKTPPREELRAAQTPQAFPLTTLRELHRGFEPGADVTDDGVLCERAGVRVRTVEGDPGNLKITTTLDLAYARHLVDSGMIEMPSLG